jgi:replicative DNA helicase
MSRREIGMRLLSARAEVSVHAMRSGTNDKEHWSRLSKERGNAEKQRLFIDDKGAIGVAYVRAKARRIKRQNGLDLIVIDYLGLMKGQGDNRTQEIGSLSRGLKALAKELGVPIIALAQLNRGVENRPDKRPMLSDLRDSGEVEQDADIVAMLHRESMYSQAPEWIGFAELLVRKNRNGPLGEVLLSYCPEKMRFDATDDASPRSTSAPYGKGRGGYTRGLNDE